MTQLAEATYLTPYLEATQRHGAGFASLLWASLSSQAARFDAISRVYDFTAKTLLDAGCGRADLLDFLITRGNRPKQYFGLEIMDCVADAAERKQHRNCTILRTDFVREPHRLAMGADVIVCCGSLNTFTNAVFYETIRAAFDAAGDALIFNFLSSPRLASARYLTWHSPSDVGPYVRTFAHRIEILDDYIDGDCTFCVHRK